MSTQNIKNYFSLIVGTLFVLRNSFEIKEHLNEHVSILSFEICNGGYLFILLEPFPRANSMGEIDTGMTRSKHKEEAFNPMVVYLSTRMDISPFCKLIYKKFSLLQFEKILHPIT